MGAHVVLDAREHGIGVGHGWLSDCVHSGAAVVRARACNTPPMRPPQGLVDHLVLLDPRLAAKRRGHDMRAVVIAVAREILDRDLGVGQVGADQILDLRGGHRHRVTSSGGAGAAMYAGSHASWTPASSSNDMALPPSRVNAAAARGADPARQDAAALASSSTAPRRSGAIASR